MDNYNRGLRNPPIVISDVNITKIEVWVTNVGITATVGARNVIGFMDLAENDPYDNNLITALTNFPDNSSNSLYAQINTDPLIRQYTSASETHWIGL